MPRSRFVGQAAVLALLAISLAPGVVATEAYGQAGGGDALDIYAGPERSSAYTIFAPRLARAVSPARTATIKPTRGTAENIAEVERDPQAVGFAQYDLYRRAIAASGSAGSGPDSDTADGTDGDSAAPEKPDLEFYGDVPVCILAVARIHGPWLLPPAELPEEAKPHRIDIGPRDADTAESLLPLVSTATMLSEADIEYRGGARALSRLRQRATDIVFLLEYPHKRTPLVAEVFASDQIGFIEDTAALLAGARSDVRGAFIPTKIQVPGSGLFSGPSEISTVCTPLGVVVNAKGDPDTLDFVVSAVTNGKLIANEPGFWQGFWNVLVGAWHRIVAAISGVFG